MIDRNELEQIKEKAKNPLLPVYQIIWFGTDTDYMDTCSNKDIKRRLEAIQKRMGGDA